VTTKKAKPKPKAPDNYVSYGFNAAVVAAIPELAPILKQAVAEGWDPQRFTDKIMTTDWWKQHSSTARQMMVLQAQDPSEYKQQVDAAVAHVQQIAAQMGVTLTAEQVQNHAIADLWQGMNDSTLQSQIGALYTGQPTTVGAGGSAVQLNQQIRQLADQYGVPVTDAWVNDHIRQALSTGNGAEGATADLQSMAASTYPALAQQILAGHTTTQIAQPYMAAMAQTLEIDPASITLKDPTIMKALQMPMPQTGSTSSTKGSGGSSTPAAPGAPASGGPGGSAMKAPLNTIQGGSQVATLGSATGAAANNAANSSAVAGSGGVGQSMMPLYQFTNMLRQDPRWQQTDNAKQTAYGMLHQLGQDMGFAS
jgi:hypothetical protein